MNSVAICLYKTLRSQINFPPVGSFMMNDNNVFDGRPFLMDPIIPLQHKWSL